MSIECIKHETSDSSIICGHLLNNKGNTLGFVENSVEKGNFQAWCFDCESLFLKEVDKTEKFLKFNNMTVVCEACYLDIKKHHEQIDLNAVAWEQREVEVYPALFGKMPETIMPLDATLFKKQFDHDSVDPTWSFYGVFAIEPNAKRDSWLYVTSGMSNIGYKENKPDDYAGYGIEFVVETKEESLWAVQVLQSLMVFNLMLAAGKYGDKPMLDYGDRIPHKANDKMTSVMIVEPIDFPSHMELKSGRVDFLQIVAISSNELAYAKEHSSKLLAQKLVDDFGSYVVDLERDGF